MQEYQKLVGKVATPTDLEKLKGKKARLAAAQANNEKKLPQELDAKATEMLLPAKKHLPKGAKKDHFNGNETSNGASRFDGDANGDDSHIHSSRDGKKIPTSPQLVRKGPTLLEGKVKFQHKGLNDSADLIAKTENRAQVEFDFGSGCTKVVEGYSGGELPKRPGLPMA